MMLRGKEFKVGAVTMAVIIASSPLAYAMGMQSANGSGQSQGGFSSQASSSQQAAGGMGSQTQSFDFRSSGVDAVSSATVSQSGTNMQNNGMNGQNGGMANGMNGQPNGQNGGMLESLASALSIETTANESAETLVSDIKTAIEALGSDDLAALAKKYNIDTTDKTDAETVTALEALLTPPANNVTLK